MSKRETILIAAMILSLVLGGGYYALDYIRPSVQQSALNLDTLNQEALLFSQSIAQNELNPRQLYILEHGVPLNIPDALAPQAWLSVLDFEKLHAEKPVSDSGEPAVELEYTGYIKVGNTYYAFIGGLEYALGDPLDDFPYVVVAITPEAVTLQSKISQRKQEIPLLKEPAYQR